MKNQKQKKLSELPAMTDFEYAGQRWRTTVPPKRTIVQPSTIYLVINLETGRLVSMKCKTIVNLVV